MSTAAPARFTFDLDLGSRQRHGRPMSDAALDAMLKDARSEGVAQGLAEAERSRDRPPQPPPPTASPTQRRHDGGSARRRPEGRRSATPSTSPRRSPASSPTASSRASPLAELEALIAECLHLARTACRTSSSAATPTSPTRVRDRDRVAHDHVRLRRPARRDRRSRQSPSATAASNGPTAASCATAPQSRPPSTTASAAYLDARGIGRPKETPQ